MDSVTRKKQGKNKGWKTAAGGEHGGQEHHKQKAMRKEGEHPEWSMWEKATVAAGIYFPAKEKKEKRDTTSDTVREMMEIRDEYVKELDMDAVEVANKSTRKQKEEEKQKEIVGYFTCLLFLFYL